MSVSFLVGSVSRKVSSLYGQPARQGCAEIRWPCDSSSRGGLFGRGSGEASHHSGALGVKQDTGTWLRSAMLTTLHSSRALPLALWSAFGPKSMSPSQLSERKKITIFLLQKKKKSPLFFFSGMTLPPRAALLVVFCSYLSAKPLLLECPYKTQNMFSFSPIHAFK